MMVFCFQERKVLDGLLQVNENMASEGIQIVTKKIRRKKIAKMLWFKYFFIEYQIL